MCALTLALVLRTPLARRIVSAPRPDRWNALATPQVGGIGIFAGLAFGTLAAVRLGILQMPLRPIAGDFRQVLGILVACGLLFVAGLLDDATYLPPLGKLAAQFGAAAIAIWAGTGTTLVHNHWLCIAIAVLWLVGITNVFNLLDLRPGRSIKALVLLGAALTAASGQVRTMWSLGLFAGPALIAGAYDLRERAMLGDTGANLLGALGGLWLVMTLSGTGQAVALGVLAAITVYGEVRSISAFVERTPGLRYLDSLGRPS